MIYLDNAATSFPKPPCVLDALTECVTVYCGNAGRSSHALSLRTAEEIYRVREEVASLFSFPKPENVVFTQNATYALNLAIKTSVKRGTHVLMSELEHNAVRRPLEKLRRTEQITLSTFSTDGNIEERIEHALRPDTSMIVSTLCSNVSGVCIPLGTLSRIKKRHPDITLIVDAAQAVGHREISLKETPCDVLCAPGHKGLFGIQGCGFAVFCDNALRDSFIEGGSGSDSERKDMPSELPERFEAGTLPSPAIVTLGEGIRYLRRLGLQNAETKLKELSLYTLEALSSLPGVRVLAPSESGVISFTIGELSSSRIADALDKKGICTRSGLHCAPLAHQKYGTLKTGAVRVGLSVLNRPAEIDALRRALCELCPRA